MISVIFSQEVSVDVGCVSTSAQSHKYAAEYVVILFSGHSFHFGSEVLRIRVGNYEDFHEDIS
jgi:hypothetical protein